MVLTLMRRHAPTRSPSIAIQELHKGKDLPLESPEHSFFLFGIPSIAMEKSMKASFTVGKFVAQLLSVRDSRILLHPS